MKRVATMMFAVAIVLALAIGATAGFPWPK
jgi:hypothetical protein